MDSTIDASDSLPTPDSTLPADERVGSVSDDPAQDAIDRPTEDHNVTTDQAGCHPRRPASPRAADSVTAGSIVGGCRVIDVLGYGGHGVVYRAEHLESGQLVALKMLWGVFKNVRQAECRFQRELQILKGLHHENIVAATGGGNWSGILFFVMDLVDGLSLTRLMRQAGSLSQANACSLAFQVAAGLQAAHELGIVHRDIKPSNLMLTRDGIVRILDFGLALFKSEGSLAKRLTSSGQVLGTPDYMAPEQIEDSREVDIRADLYSLGCVLYSLLSGKPPFRGPRYRSPLSKLQAHCRDLPLPIGLRCAGIRPEVAAIVSRLLSKNPDHRPRTPAEVVEHLRSHCTGSDPAALAKRYLA
jgi:serine/threonine protein kinase